MSRHHSTYCTPSLDYDHYSDLDLRPYDLNKESFTVLHKSLYKCRYQAMKVSLLQNVMFRLTARHIRSKGIITKAMICLESTNVRPWPCDLLRYSIPNEPLKYFLSKQSNQTFLQLFNRTYKMMNVHRDRILKIIS